MSSSNPFLREMEEVETHRPATPDRHLCAGVLSASDRSRSPAPRDPEEGGLVVEVELVLALSGRPLAYKTFSMPKDRGSALGSLIAMGAPYETDKDKKYSYFFSLEDKKDYPLRREGVSQDLRLRMGSESNPYRPNEAQRGRPRLQSASATSRVGKR